MSARRSSKRGAAASSEADSTVAASDASAAPPPKRQRGARPPVGSLKEGDAPLSNGADDWAFWEKFHTELIRAWFMDFSDWKKRARHVSHCNRALLLETVIGANTPRPKGKHSAALAAMQAVFSDKNPGSPVPSVWPDPHVALSVPKAAKGVSFSDSAQGGMPLQHSSPADAFSVDDDEKMGDEEEEEDPATAAAAVAAAKARRSAAAAAKKAAPIVLDHDWSDGCKTCLLVPAEDEVKNGAWVCTSCKIRGDLLATDPANIFLRERASSSKGQSAPAAAAAGQTTTDTSDSAPLDRLEKFLREQCSSLGAPHPLFLPSAAAPTSAEAIDTVRQALGASSMAAPSPQLINLIQSGKLRDVWFAVPRPFLKLHAASASSLATIDFNGAGGPTVNTANDPTKSQPLDSVAQFTAALVNTILPSLISRPAAIAQWLALASSVFHIAADPRKGWLHARAYLEATLNDRVGRAEKLPLAPPNEAALRDIQFASTSAFSAAPGKFAPAAGQTNEVCGDFNNKSTGCFRGAFCKFRHVCSGCGGTHPASQSPSCVRGFGAGANRPPGSGGQKKPKNGGGGSARPASSSAGSVASAAASKAAATSHSA